MTNAFIWDLLYLIYLRTTNISADFNLASINDCISCIKKNSFFHTNKHAVMYLYTQLQSPSHVPIHNIFNLFTICRWTCRYHIYHQCCIFFFFVLHERQDNNIFVWIVIVSLEWINNDRSIIYLFYHIIIPTL